MFRYFPAIFALALCLSAGPAAAQVDGPVLQIPLDCALPDRCAIQFHVDRAGGPDVADFRCGRLSYDTHRGTDFRVLTHQDFAAGVPVLAAAPGRVAAIRDGMEDIDVGELGREKVEGRAGGNQVVIVHDGGWETHYWHLRKGSVAVKQGQSVVAGTRLGLVGLSGDTTFPHLHFELRHNRNTVVDPFDTAPSDQRCGGAGHPLWSPQAMARMAYVPVMARLGFSTRALTKAEAIYDRAPDTLPGKAPPALFAWFEIYGLMRGDRISLQWGLPDGSWRRPAQIVWQSDLPYIFQVGKLTLDPPLPPGSYAARLRVERGGSATALYDKTLSVRIE